MEHDTVTEEEKIRDEIRNVYNSGDAERAKDMSIEFLARFPKSPLARYQYAVMHGDSVTDSLAPAEKQRRLDIAKQGVSELFHDPALASWPAKFQRSVRNEYFWFFELPEKQYELGMDELAHGENGHYSATVGASMMALKELKHGGPDAREWAERSVHHFKEYEKLVPYWYNINYFAAQAFACLGRFDDARACYLDSFRKQKAPPNEADIANFEKHIDEIKKLIG